MSKLSSDELAAIRARLAHADREHTWESRHAYGYVVSRRGSGRGSWEITVCEGMASVTDFIAHVREDVAALLDTVAALDAEVSSLRSEVAAAGAIHTILNAATDESAVDAVRRLVNEKGDLIARIAALEAEVRAARKEKP